MPATKHRRRGRARPRWVPPPPPPRRPITDEERREDALLVERLQKLYGPPATIHQYGDIDWSWDQYEEAITQLVAEGAIRRADELVE
jgi:hypothetical protein